MNDLEANDLATMLGIEEAELAGLAIVAWRCWNAGDIAGAHVVLVMLRRFASVTSGGTVGDVLNRFAHMCTHTETWLPPGGLWRPDQRPIGVPPDALACALCGRWALD